MAGRRGLRESRFSGGSPQPQPRCPWGGFLHSRPQGPASPCAGRMASTSGAGRMASTGAGQMAGTRGQSSSSRPHRRTPCRAHQAGSQRSVELGR
eukprot:2463173-Heterocapsa_arctica.AAC.1